MTPDELRELLSQQEGLKLDFKREYHLNRTPPHGTDPRLWAKLVEGQRHELIKDILALTNGNVGTAEQPGYLVIGAGDDEFLQSEGVRPLFDMRHLQLNSQELLQLVNAACYPPLHDLSWEPIELDEKVVIVITIPPTPYVHETSRQLRPIGGKIDELTGRVSVSEKTPITERTAFVRRREGIYPANKDERRALAADKSPETFIIEPESLDLDEFTISEAEKAKLKAIFFPPKNYRRIEQTLLNRGRLWIVGASGLWKRYLALSLALDQRVLGEVYWIPRFVDWDQLAETNVSNSILIFPDALGLNQYETRKIEGEFRSWEKLRSNGNFIIATSSDDVFDDASKETRLSEFIAKDELILLGVDSFDYGDKKEIFRRLVRYSHEQRSINERQNAWALGLLQLADGHSSKGASDTRVLSSALAHKLLREVWLPVDIERFICEGLSSVRTEEEVFELLQKYADLEKRIHTWFLELDSSARCFVLTLSIFSGFQDREIWSRHQRIVERLRRLDPGLSIPPLGILRQLTRPYVTGDGSLEFSNPRVFRMVTRELSITYREYFSELLDLLKEWSIPELPASLSKEERDVVIRDTEGVRNAIARVAGEMGRADLDSIIDLLEAWSTHRMGRIGKTAGIALKEVAKDPATAHNALALLNEWSADTSSGDSYYRRWAAASALGRILSMKSRFGTSEQALTILQRLALDQENYVASAVPQAFRAMGSALPVEALSGVLTRLAKRDKFTRQEVAGAVDEAAGQQIESVAKLLDIWAASRSGNIRWTAIFTLLTARRIPEDEKCRCLIRFLATDSNQVIEIVREILEDDNPENRQTAKAIFADLARRSERTRADLIALLVREYDEEPHRTQMLLENLSSGSLGTLQEIQFEVQAKTPAVALKTLLQEPSEQRAPFLLRLLDEAPLDSVEAVREALWGETENSLDWFLSTDPEAIMAAEFWADGPSTEVRSRIRNIADVLREKEQTRVQFLRFQISGARTEAAEVGIKDFTEIDRSVAQIEALCGSNRYRDYLAAEQRAHVALLTMLSSCTDELKRTLAVKYSALNKLKAQRDSKSLTQKKLQDKAATVNLLVTLVMGLVTFVAAGLLLLIFIEPTKNFTLDRAVSLKNGPYPSGSEFAVLEESDDRMCIEVQGERDCNTRENLLSFGRITNSYSMGMILRIPFIVVCVLVLGLFVRIVISRRYRNYLHNEQSTSFGRAIRQAEMEIRGIAKVQEHFASSAIALGSSPLINRESTPQI